MSLEMAHKVILPPKKNYIPQFLKQRDINSYYNTLGSVLLFASGNGIFENIWQRCVPGSVVFGAFFYLDPG
jgi:hypothetical protein